MAKEIWKSKTILGFSLFALVAFTQQVGWVGENFLVSVLEYGGAILGVVGARQALK